MGTTAPDAATIRPEQTLTTSDKRALVDRVAESELFQKAPRLRELFLYVAECTLEGRSADAREHVIAERVFHRGSDFQGTQDSIVRAEARNLRKRLESYFAAEGSGENVVISMPRGGYTLAFESRGAAVACLEVYSSHAPTGSLTDSGPLARHSPVWLRHVAWILAGASVLLATLTLGYAIGRIQAQHQLHIVRPILPFSALFSRNRDSVIVTSDTGFLQIAALAHHLLSLDDYIARSYPSVPGITPRDLIRNWNLYEFTDGREMALAGLILGSYPQFAQRISLKSGHKVTLDMLKTHTAVLIGSPVSNPWAQVYEDRLNFRCVFDSGRIVFRNGGKDFPNADDDLHGRTYARLAFLPGSSTTPAVFLIAGVTAQSTEAAGQLVLDRNQFAQMLRKIGINPAGQPRFFEMLLRSNVFVSGSTVPQLVDWRLNPAPEP